MINQTKEYAFEHTKLKLLQSKPPELKWGDVVPGDMLIDINKSCIGKYVVIYMKKCVYDLASLIDVTLMNECLQVFTLKRHGNITVGTDVYISASRNTPVVSFDEDEF